MQNRKLNFGLIPSSSWYNNLRSNLPNWSEISNKTRTAGKCKICGKTDEPKNLHAHEVWEFDDKTCTQYLMDIIPICSECHESIHIGHAQLEERLEPALEHYAKVNGITEDEAINDLNEAVVQWKRRSISKWKLERNIEKKVEAITGIMSDYRQPVNGKYYAVVNYEEKELAKMCGAKWDPDKRMWYFRNYEDRENWNMRECII